MKNDIRDLLQRKTDSSPFTADDISGKLESIEKKTKIKGIAMGGIGIVIITLLLNLFNNSNTELRNGGDYKFVSDDNFENIDSTNRYEYSKVAVVDENSEMIDLTAPINLSKDSINASKDIAINISKQISNNSIDENRLSTELQPAKEISIATAYNYTVPDSVIERFMATDSILNILQMSYQKGDITEDIYKTMKKNRLITLYSKDVLDTNRYDINPDSIYFNFLSKYNDKDTKLPVLSISLNELNDIVPGSYNNGRFNTFYDFIVHKEELVEYDSILDIDQLPDNKFIQRFKYQNGVYLHDSTRFNIGIPITDSYREIEQYDPTLYVSYTDYAEYSDSEKPYFKNYPFISPIISKSNLIPEQQRLEAIKDSLLFYMKNDKSKRYKIFDYLNALDTLQLRYHDLRSQLIPVKVTPFRDYYVVLWFYPTKEFISKLPDRYRNDMAEQYELYKQMKNKGEGLGEVCIKLDGKTDYFGICGERRGAIEKIRFTSTTTNNISADLRLKEDRTLKVYISTIMGQVVHQEEMSLSGGAQLIDVLPTKPLQSGPYFFVIESDKGELAIEKIFINQ